MSSDPVAIITGASQGIGKSCAIGLSKMGYRCVLVSRTASKLQSVADDIRNSLSKQGGLDPIVHPLDVSDFEGVKNFVDSIVDQVGRIDVLVNNAGIFINDTLDIAIRDFDRMVRTNLHSPFVLMKKIVPIMKKQGKGHIFNIASRAGKVGLAGEGAYVASKHGLVGLNESLYRELAGAGISVTAICPGWVNTEMADQAGAALKGEDMIQPGDIMKTLQWILSLAPGTRVKEVLLESAGGIF